MMLAITWEDGNSGSGRWDMFWIGCSLTFDVLHRPFGGFFICPLAVAVLGGRYLVISCSMIFGQPWRKPARVTLSNVESGGLHNNWCANVTALDLVVTEYEKLIVLMGRGFFITPCGFPSVLFSVLIGRVHKSVAGSLYPVKIILSL
jgi:hypothetical protein